MKVKTSITVDKDLLEAVDNLTSGDMERSKFIEAAIHAYIAQHPRCTSDVQDLEIINEAADTLNQEAMDVLDYQVAL